MRSDDDQFASRQVASSTLLRNTSLVAPVPYRTEVFDLRPFASASLWLEPSPGSVYPCYATLEWWNDQAMSILVRTDKVLWIAPSTPRTWIGTVPCRSDWMSITIDSLGAATLNMIVAGQSRSPDSIAQQLPTAAAGLPPFALLQAAILAVPPGVGAPFYVPPWFGDIEISVQSTSLAADGNSVVIDDVTGTNLFQDQTLVPLNGAGGSFAASGFMWNRIRMAAAGCQLRFRAVNNGAVARDFLVAVEPVTGL